METTPKMLNIRIGYDAGRKLKAACALRGKSLREVVEEFADMYVKHAHELPSIDTSQSVRMAALSQAVSDEEQPPQPKKKKAGRSAPQGA